MEGKPGNQSDGLVSRRTRSQVAPDWSVSDLLVLMNEIAAVEWECQKTLSTFQKWKIISENCAAFDVVRNSNQCQRKWHSLLVEYNKIKRWELQSGGNSYWSMNSERRKEIGLPENFDNELFNAIDNVIRAQQEQLDSDPDSDLEAEADMLPDIGDSGSKSRKWLPVDRKRNKLQRISLEEKGSHSNTIEKSKKNNAAGKPMRNRRDEMPEGNSTRLKRHIEEQAGGSYIEKEPQKDEFQINEAIEKEDINVEEKEQMMAAKLRANAELIHAIVNETPPENNGDHGTTSLKKLDFQTDFVRCQGDRLILCLGDIVSTLSQLSDLFQECE